MKIIKTRSPMGGSGKATVRAAERQVAIIREGMSVEVEKLRESLGKWIEENTHRANDAEISIALLETVFDRYIDLLGATDASELIESAFRRRAEYIRRSLQ